MHLRFTSLRQLLLPALLLTSLALASCGCHKDDPRPKGKCGNPTSSSTKPSGNS